MTRHDALRRELESLATETADENYADFDQLPLSAQLSAFTAASHAAVAAVDDVAPDIGRAVEEIVGRLKRGGRLIYIGAGTAGRMGVLDASEIPPTFGTDPSLVVGLIAGGDIALRSAVENAEDDAEAGARTVREITLSADDAIVGISASGRTPYVIGALDEARSVGAVTISLACNRAAAISRDVDIAIEVNVGPEVIAGSTRLKAGTAQKLVLNAISSLVMVRLGKVHGNLMVDVQATNEKLRARAERIVMLATDADADVAARALDVSDGSVKHAIALIRSGASIDRVREVLAAKSGMLRDALDTLIESEN